MTPTLDMDGYIRLGRDRAAFDEWLRAEGLMEQNITMIRFGEGYVEARCLVDLPRSTAAEWRRLPTRTAPPAVVLQALLDA